MVETVDLCLARLLDAVKTANGILIVTADHGNSDDMFQRNNDVNRKIAQLILQKAGYQVDAVEDGRQAVEACQQNHYDLILMDIWQHMRCSGNGPV